MRDSVDLTGCSGPARNIPLDVPLPTNDFGDSVSSNGINANFFRFFRGEMRGILGEDRRDQVGIAKFPCLAINIQKLDRFSRVATLADNVDSRSSLANAEKLKVSAVKTMKT